MSIFSINSSKATPGLGGGFLESVEIHYDHIDGLNSVPGHGCDMLRIFATKQNAAVNLGMQRLDAAVEHFRKTSKLGDVFYGDCRNHAAVWRCLR